MGRPIILTYPGNERLANRLVEAGGERVEVRLRSFPDGESYVQIMGDVQRRRVTIVCSMAQPDAIFLKLAMLASAARDLGAEHLTLVAPYLSYMRQDERFHEGEGVTSVYFARLLSGLFDALITVDPHLHRWSDLGQIYDIDTHHVSAAPALARWVQSNIEEPMIIGPDSESEQWVDALADALDAPRAIFEKVRHGDRDVEVQVEDITEHIDRQIVILDDIISTGQTLARTVNPLLEMGFAPPICLGIHAVFSDDVELVLERVGASALITTNTISHSSNAIDVDNEIVEAWQEAISE
ncbi:MAG: ribose-phosphate diphosphokinase [Myxococcota bacterium]|nr:ribose-phosphate diphosphokinase [Myxococcota bacterium]MEC9439506.1 ribose-phosphate diphosphokinase [Myxococcota bacterium]